MRKSSRSAKKGQWFLLSAVLITSSFLAISVLFQGYRVIDPTAPLQKSEQYYFSHVKHTFDMIVREYQFDECGKKTDEFIAFAQKEMSKKGFFLVIEKGNSCPQPQNRGILLVSETAVLYEHIDPNEYITGLV